MAWWYIKAWLRSKLLDMEQRIHERIREWLGEGKPSPTPDPSEDKHEGEGE